MVPYMARSLITKAVMGAMTTNDKIVVYVKRHENREWNLLLDEARQEVYVENKKARKHLESLNKLDITYTLCYQKHIKNCALQNVFKLFNWHYHHEWTYAIYI